MVEKLNKKKWFIANMIIFPLLSALLFLDIVFFSIRYIWGGSITPSLILENLGLFSFSGLEFYWKETLGGVITFGLLLILLKKYKRIGLLLLLIINSYFFLSFHRKSSDAIDIYEKYLAVPQNIKGDGKNIIVIVLESFDMRFSAISNGKENENIIPNLISLLDEGITFNGWHAVNFTWPTMPGYYGITFGLPRGEKNVYDFFKQKNDLSKAVSITDLFHKKSFRNIHIRGAELSNNSMDKLGKAHHYDLMIGYDEIRKEFPGLPKSTISTLNEKTNKITGIKMFPDSVVLQKAKEVLEKEVKKGKFFMSILTGNTHGPIIGYTETFCEKKYGDIRDAYKCSDKIIYDFILWVKQQSWYKDTIIFLIGDHLAWDKSFYRMTTKVPEELIYGDKQKVYNVLLNSDIKKDKILHKNFCSFDWAPTIIEAAGFKIFPRKLNLGVSLFSKEETILEKLSIKGLNDILEKSISNYNKHFMTVE